MKTPYWLLSSTLTLAVLASCETSKPATDVSASAGSGTAATTRPGGSGESMESNPEAQMQLRTPIANSTVPSGEVPFNYQISNFLLTKMSGGPHMAEMANSAKGQHIHNIVDNEPYTAHYETTFSKAIPDGQHAVLSFLSRSYHESLKHRGAYDLRIINVGNGARPTTPIINVNGPNLFYSRPKDTYSGADAKRVMLDFYLVNTTLEPGGNRVRATINGTEFMLDRWMPYMMEGLPAGENTVKLELVDSSGTLIPGTFNSVTRKFTVAP
jgi:hypothetical protein